MIITSLHLQNGTLLIAALINIVMSIIVFSRGMKNKINLYFGLLTFFNFLWALSLFFARTLESDIWFLAAQLAYPFALGIAVFLLYFSLYFPFINHKFNYIVHFLIWIPAIFLAVIPFISGAFIVSSEKHISQTLYILYYYKPMYVIFTVYFFIIVITAIFNLFKKYKKIDGPLSKQTRWLSFAIIIGLLTGSYFDLILCYFGNFKYVWIGPIFTAFMNGYVFYLITSSKEKINNG
ncbi:MAG: histidine kinase N-terminal 7TM domain-containing protein [Sulfurimicrobium sp.]|nr:histidine kinase N-terminal 7TM domain-containing protein [Sulfurimicrobium sp.]